MSSFPSLCNLYLSVNICLKMLLKNEIRIIVLVVCINICNYLGGTKECIGLQKVSACGVCIFQTASVWKCII